MNIINLYPKIAKYTLILIFTAVTVSFMTLVILSSIEHNQDQLTRIASATFLILAIPLISTFQFFNDPIQKLANDHEFIDSKELLIKIKPLLIGVNGEIRVGQYPSNERNAFAISSVFGQKSLIAFSTNLISSASESEFLALAAHEVAHLKNGDSENKIYILAFNHALRTYPYLLSSLSKELFRKGVWIFLSLTIILFAIILSIQGIPESTEIMLKWLWSWGRIGIWPALVIAGYIGLNHVLNRAFFAYSRAREFEADATGAEMTSVEEMIAALNLLSDPMEIVSVFDTHPPLEERKQRLFRKA